MPDEEDEEFDLSKDTKDRYEEWLAVDDDEKRFVLAIHKISKIFNAIGDLRIDFGEEQIDGHLALVNLEALLSMIEDIRKHIKDKI